MTNALRRVRLIFCGVILCVLSAGASAYALSHTSAVQPSLPATALPVLVHPRLAHPQRRALPGGQCTPEPPYELPAPLSTESRASGVYLQIDPAETYQVGGSAPAGIIQEIERCTPVRSDGLFAANTGYSLSTNYAYTPGSDGLCRVTIAVVTLHINQVFPAWTGRDESATKNQWSSFIRNLQTHEQGHVELDKDYAQKMYSVMATATPGDCATFRTNVDGAIQRLRDELEVQNENYDTQTKHGTTQGAVL